MSHKALNTRRNSNPNDIEIHYFSLKASESYKALTITYENTIANSGDPQRLSQFITTYPYHIEALLSLSYLLECQSQFNDAHLLINRILFIYQQCFHKDFSIETGQL